MEAHTLLKIIWRDLKGLPAEIEMLPISSPHHFVGAGSDVIFEFMETKEFHPQNVYVAMD